MAEHGAFTQTNLCPCKSIFPFKSTHAYRRRFRLLAGGTILSADSDLGNDLQQHLRGFSSKVLQRCPLLAHSSGTRSAGLELCLHRHMPRLVTRRSIHQENDLAFLAANSGGRTGGSPPERWRPDLPIHAQERQPHTMSNKKEVRSSNNVNRSTYLQ